MIRRRIMGGIRYIAPGYIALEYVESLPDSKGTGKSYTRTSVQLNCLDNFDIDYQVYGHEGSFFGTGGYYLVQLAQDTSGSNTYNGGLRLKIYTDVRYYYPITSEQRESRHLITKRGSILYFDNEAAITDLPLINQNSSQPFSICTARHSTNDDGGVYRPSGKYYRFTIYNLNTSVVKNDFRPALRESDGVAGWYDLVDQQFYTSYSSTPYTAGPYLK